MEAIERADRSELTALQEGELHTLITRTWARVPFYRRRWQAVGLRPDAIRRREDLQLLPIVTKQDFETDLREHPPFGTYQGDFPAVRIQASSGTTGDPKPIFHTQTDWERIAQLWARRLRAQGVRTGDHVQIAFTYALFIAGFSAIEGAMRLGATVIPTGSGAVTPSRRQLEVARTWQSTVLGTTGTYALRLAEVAREMGVDPAHDFHFRLMFHTAEPLTEEVRREIERRWRCRSYDNYGSVETGAPTYECEQQQGLHISEDAYIFEVVDPDTDEVLAPGEEGALVITSLFKEAGPVIRFKIGDIAAIWPEPCPCGRTFLRMSPVRGRVDEMVKVRGITLYPLAVESVLHTFPELGAEWRLVVDRVEALDRVLVQVELTGQPEARGAVEPSVRVQLAARVAARLKERIGLWPEVEIFGPGQLMPREEVDRRIKGQRVVDRRKASS